MRLFEIVLLEYDRDVTISKFGKRIFQAAKFNEQYLDDMWFYGDGEPVDTEESMIREVLKELEFMDPTDNKQYVMTLVRWYVGNIKKDKQNQAEFREMQKREPEKFAKYKDYKDVPGNVAGGELNDEYPELWIQPQSMNTFKLEDAVQVREALVAFHRMKPQLPQNERDIGRFKDFYRFEDFVDSRQGLDANFEIDDDTLKRSDVVVLYNGVEGTVTVPKTHQASCELGSGTRWCTASSGNDDFYNSYSQKADLIIYNEKPGNAKYQFQYYFDKGNGLMRYEATDARDRPLNQEKKDYFLNQHPIMSKILQKSGYESWATIMNKPYSSAYQHLDFEQAVKMNAQYGGGARPLLDSFFINRLSSIRVLDQKDNLGFGNGIKDAVGYAQQRGKPWPAFEEATIRQLNSFLMDILGAKASRSNISGGGPAFKGDALMRLMRAGLVGKHQNQGHFLAVYIKALKVYKDTVNPNWKAFDNYLKAYRHAFGVHRDQNRDVDTGKRTSADVGPPKKGQAYPGSDLPADDHPNALNPIHPVEEMRMLLNKLN